MMTLPCPRCSTALAELPDSGTRTSRCTQCGLAYAVVRGRIIERNDRRATAPAPEIGAFGLRRARYYVIRLEVPRRRVEKIEFTIARETAQLHRDDDMAVVYGRHWRRRKQLLAVHDLTSGESYVTLIPGASLSLGCAAIPAALLAALVGLVALLLVRFTIAASIAAGTVVATVVMLLRFFIPVPLLTPSTGNPSVRHSELLV